MWAHKIILVVTVFPDKAMTVAYTRIKFLYIISHFFFESHYQLICLGGSYLISAMVKNDLVLIIFLILCKRNYVTSVRGFIRLHLNTHTDCFKRRTSLGIDFGIKRKYSHISRIAFGHHTFGNVGNSSDKGALSECIHGGLFGFLHRCEISQFSYRLISHTVGNKNKIFHICNPFISLNGVDPNFK